MEGCLTTEIGALIATEIAMGLVHKPNVEDYFQDSFFLTETPGFRTIFSRDCYQLIKSCLHFADNDSLGDRLYKITSIINIVKDLYWFLLRINVPDLK